MLGPDANLHVVPQAVHVFGQSADEGNFAVVFKGGTASPLTGTAFKNCLFGSDGVFVNLARHAETKILFQELLPRLRSIEIMGPVERIRSDFVNGIKKMPVQIRAR